MGALFHQVMWILNKVRNRVGLYPRYMMFTHVAGFSVELETKSKAMINRRIFSLKT